MERPNTRERRALQSLRGLPWELPASLYPAGKGTIDGIVAKGWAEWLDPLPSGLKRIRITPSGNDALDSPQPSPLPKSKPRLKVLTPRLAELPPRLKPPK